MAVQMMMSSTQDFLALSTSSDIAPTQARPGSSEGFDRALEEVAGASSDASRPDRAERTHARPAPEKKPPQKVKNDKSEAAPQQEDAARQETPVAVVNVTEQEAQLVENDLKTLIAQSGADVEETSIDDLIADAPEPKQPRFDPDAILNAYPQKSDAVAAPLLDAQPEETVTAPASQIPADPAPVMPTADELADGFDALDDVVTVGQDETGEIAMKLDAPEAQDQEQPIEAEAPTTDALPDAKTLDDGQVVKAQAPEAKKAEAAAQTEDVKAQAPAPDAPKETSQKADEPRPVGEKSVDERIDELIAKYRSAREDAQDDLRGGSHGSRDLDRGPRDFMQMRKPAQSSSTQRKASETQLRRSIEPSTDSHARESAFVDTLASRLRESAERAFAPEAQPMSRAGMSYAMDRQAPFTDGIFTALEFMKTDGVQEARIVVEPPALGHIDVSIRATESGMQAAFKVDNEHLKQMVQQHLDILKSSLQTQGIHVSSIAVDIRNKDDQNGQGAAYAKNSKKGKHFGGSDDGDQAETEATLVRLDLEKGLLHWVG